MLKAGSVNEHFIGLITFKYKGFNFNLCCKMPKGVRYGRWNPEDLERPLETVRNVDVDLNAASPEDPVPKTALRGHLHGKNYECFATQDKKCLRRQLNGLRLLTDLHLKRLEKVGISNSSWKFKIETAKETERTIVMFETNLGSVTCAK
jgi:hypothetical protein